MDYKFKWLCKQQEHTAISGVKEKGNSYPSGDISQVVYKIPAQTQKLHGLLQKIKLVKLHLKSHPTVYFKLYKITIIEGRTT